ncbi:MAG TPA: hypothetical protein VL332_01660 [Candidatus Saccharimonadaceae bacterium]|jgi:hypothetical protein|nr:hypothetical protein [Candidatus Saccharimonadaceae bacterium]
MRRVLLALLLCFACASCGRKGTQTSAPVARAPEATPYEFLDTVLKSLARAQTGIKMVEDASTQSDLVDLMTANQNASIALRMAENELRPFAASQDSTRRDAVEAILNGYEMIGNSLDLQLRGYEKIDSARTADALLGMRKMVSDGRVAYQQGSAVLIDAAGLALGSAIVPSPGDSSQHIALNLSASEKAQLLAATDSLFGADVQTVGDASGPLAAAMVMRKWLDQEWRLAR